MLSEPNVVEGTVAFCTNLCNWVFLTNLPADTQKWRINGSSGYRSQLQLIHVDCCIDNPYEFSCQPVDEYFVLLLILLVFNKVTMNTCKMSLWIPIHCGLVDWYRINTVFWLIKVSIKFQFFSFSSFLMTFVMYVNK